MWISCRIGPEISEERGKQIKAHFDIAKPPYSAPFIAVIKDFDFDTLGQEDLSIQAKVESGPTIANFLHDGKLFTVIEARQSSAEINSKMRGFINTPHVTAQSVVLNLKEALPTVRTQ